MPRAVANAIALACVAVNVGACKGKATKAAAKGCDLAGHYRLRFDAGVGQWLWFRFRVDERVTTATMTPPYGLDAKRDLKLSPDPVACKLSVTDGELLGEVTLDPKTNLVKGTLRLSGSREGVELRGVRDPGTTPPPSKRGCIAPGVYTFTVPSEQAWTSADGGSCDKAVVSVPFLLEELGDELVIDAMDEDGNAAWAAEDVYEDSPCEAEVRFRHREWDAYTKLSFGGDKVTAEASRASVQILDNGDTRRCAANKPMAWVERRK